MKIIFNLLLLLVCLSCKRNAEPSSAIKQSANPTFSNVQDTVQAIKTEDAKSLREDTIHKSGLQTGENYAFYKTYLYHPDSSYVPEYTLDEVNKKFRMLRVMLSKDSISINEKKSAYTIIKRQAKKFFIRNYLYNYYTSAFKKGFDLNVSEEVTGLFIEAENIYEEPFIDFMMKTGKAVFMEGCLYLNYDLYIICFKKEKDIVEKNQQLCNLPFDYSIFYKIIESNYDDLELYCPLVSGFKRDQLARIIFRSINEVPDYIWQINNGKKNFETFIYEYGASDNFKTLINIREGKFIAEQKVGLSRTDEDDYYTTFVVNKDLTISIFKIIYGQEDKELIKTYRITSDGEIVLVK